MAHPPSDNDGKPLNSVGRVLDSRWMMAFSVLAVLVAIAWALLERGPNARPAETPETDVVMATVELLGVPPGAEVSLDGRRIENTAFGVKPGTRHALEVTDIAEHSSPTELIVGSLHQVGDLEREQPDPEADEREETVEENGPRLGKQSEADSQESEEEVGAGGDLKGSRFILHGRLSCVANLGVDQGSS